MDGWKSQSRNALKPLKCRLQDFDEGWKEDSLQGGLFTDLAGYCWLLAGGPYLSPNGPLHRAAYVSSPHGSWPPDCVIQEHARWEPQ